jgi:hypothetical protein
VRRYCKELHFGRYDTNPRLHACRVIVRNLKGKWQNCRFSHLGGHSPVTLPVKGTFIYGDPYLLWDRFPGPAKRPQQFQHPLNRHKNQLQNQNPHLKKRTVKAEKKKKSCIKSDSESGMEDVDEYVKNRPEMFTMRLKRRRSESPDDKSKTLTTTSGGAPKHINMQTNPSPTDTRTSTKAGTPREEVSRSKTQSGGDDITRE